MKKIIALCLAIMLVLAAIPVATVFAANDPTFVVSTDKADAVAGEEVTVTVSTKNNPGVVSIKVKVGWDADVFEFVSFERNAAVFTGNPGFMDPVNTSKNPITFNWSDSMNKAPDAINGVFVTLTLKVKEGAALGDTGITLTYDPDDVFDNAIDMENVAFAIENTSVEIIDCRHGDTTRFTAAESTCQFQGNNEYVFCNDCETVIEGSDEKLPFADCKRTNHIANPPSHFADGNIEYWTCDVCGKYYVEGTDTDWEEIDEEDIVDPKIPHTYNEVDGDATHHWNKCECGAIDESSKVAHSGGTATCDTKAVCGCGMSYGDVDANNHVGTTTTHEAKASTCKVQGNNEYKTCDDCGAVVEGSDAKLPLDANNHVGTTTTHEAKASTCNVQGNNEYKTCDDCDAVVEGSDEKLPLDAENHVGTTTTHEAKASTCKVEGNNEYKTCDDCGKVVEGSDEKLPIDAENHANVKTVPAKESTCVDPGNDEYKVCDDCGVVVEGSDAELPLADHVELLPATCVTKAICLVCEQEYGEINPDNHLVLIPDENVPHTATEPGLLKGECSLCEEYVEMVIPAGHELLFMEGVDATHDEDGFVDHFMCLYCDSLFLTEEDANDDSKAVAEDDVVLEKVPHAYELKYDEENHWNECECGETKDKAAHDFTEEIVDGMLVKTCECGYEVSEEIDTPDDDDDETSTPEDSEGVTPDDGEDAETPSDDEDVDADVDVDADEDADVDADDDDEDVVVDEDVDADDDAEEKEEPESPKTGDMANILVAIAMLTAFAAAGVVVLKKKA